MDRVFGIGDDICRTLLATWGLLVRLLVRLAHPLQDVIESGRYVKHQRPVFTRGSEIPRGFFSDRTQLFLVGLSFLGAPGGTSWLKSLLWSIRFCLADPSFLDR